MKYTKLMQKTGPVAVAAALAALMPGAALADGPQATGIAVQHAGFAAGSTDAAVVKRHLHHVLNCLVGPEGEGFDAAPGNPCAASGGAIPQTTDAAAKDKLQKAAAQVRAVIANGDLDATRKVAADVQTALK